jgi:hypothetical protein
LANLPTLRARHRIDFYRAPVNELVLENFHPGNRYFLPENLFFPASPFPTPSPFELRFGVELGKFQFLASGFVARPLRVLLRAGTGDLGRQMILKQIEDQFWFGPDAGVCIAFISEKLLYPEEQALVKGAFPHRQAEFSTGRWCAREAIKAVGAAPVPIPAGPRHGSRDVRAREEFSANG